MTTDITINISVNPEGVNVSQGDAELSQESITIPDVPAMPDDFAQSAEFAPPVSDEEVAIFSADEFIEPPEEEDATSDTVPEVPSGE